MTDDDQPSAPWPHPVEPLAARLRRPPSPKERSLAELAGLSDVQGAPAHMLVKVAMMADHHERFIDRIERAWKRSKRYVLANVITAATTLAAIGVWWIHADEARVAAVERAAAEHEADRVYRETMGKTVDGLNHEIEKLRDQLFHHLGIVVPPSPISIVQREDHTP